MGCVYQMWYDWKEFPTGLFAFDREMSSNSFVIFILKAIPILLRYRIVDIEIRKGVK